jgi:hypothetical protein
MRVVQQTLNNAETPVSAYRKLEINPAYGSDATMHAKKEGNSWSSPDLVSGIDKRQIGQQIAIDQNNDVHVVETEFYASSQTQLVHYHKMNNSWVGQAIDSSNHMCHFPKLLYERNCLYVVYRHSDASGTGDLRFSKYDIITDIKEEAKQTPELKIYPNPGSDNISIEFENSSRQLVDLSVYDINGKLVSVLAHKILPPGMQRFVWEAHSTNGQKVKPGTYLVKLTAGDNTATQVVEIVK